MKLTPIALVVFATCGSVLAEDTHRQQDAHVHGHAELNLAISGNTVQLEFDSPAMNLVGFENPPSSGKDRKLVDDSVEFLNNPSGWIGLASSAGCTVTQVDVESSLVQSHSHEEHAHEKDNEDQHADFEVSVEFQCKDTDQLENVDLSGLFQRFSGFDEIEVQWLTDRIQSSTELNAQNPIISLR